MKASNLVNHLLEADLDDPDEFMQRYEPKFVIMFKSSSVNGRAEFWGGTTPQGNGSWAYNPMDAGIFTYSEMKSNMDYLRAKHVAIGGDEEMRNVRILPVTVTYEQNKKAWDLVYPQKPHKLA